MVERKYQGPTRKITHAVEIAKDVKHEDIWHDLGALFVDVCATLPQKVLDEFLAKHPLAKKVVEAI
jgi:hypothetical protein